VDDPEKMPDDMEGHDMELVDESGDQMEGQEGGISKWQSDALGSLSLFEAYQATIAAKSRSNPVPVPVES
jgi:hypothetical protein